MRPSSKRLLTAVFTAFFGCVSLFGQGLHYFVGHSHHGPSGAHRHGATADADHRLVAADGHVHGGHCHAGHDHGPADHANHDHGPAEHAKHARATFAATANGAGDSSSVPGIESPDHDHDCAICSFFAQAQGSSAAAGAYVGVANTALAVAAEQAFHTGPIGLYLTRGPPAGGTIS